MAEPDSTNIQRQILHALREFHPLKVDEKNLISIVQNKVKNANIDQILKDTRVLRDNGLIDVSVVKAPFEKTETFHLKITPAGIDHIRSLEEKESRSRMVLAEHMESRLAETHNKIKVDMADISKDLENRINDQNRSIEAIAKRCADLSKELAEVKELLNKLIEKTEAEKVREEHLILRVLTGDERTIYDIILNAEGVMLQKDLIARTKMSNSKVSRVVDHLESRGILTKERYGATNRLRITLKN